MPVDAIPGEYTGTADKAAVQDLAWRIQRCPARLQRGVGVGRQRRSPVGAAVVFGQATCQPGELAQIGFTRARAFVVGLTGHHAATGRSQRHRTCEQGARFFALPRRQHQHQCIARAVGLDLAFFTHVPAVTLQRFGERAEALLAGQRLGHRLLAQRETVACAQEQHRPLRPRQHALGEGQEQGLKRGIVRASHRIIGSGTGRHCK